MSGPRISGLVACWCDATGAPFAPAAEGGVAVCARLSIHDEREAAKTGWLVSTVYVDTAGMHGIGEGKDIYCGPKGHRGMPEVTTVVVALTT